MALDEAFRQRHQNELAPAGAATVAAHNQGKKVPSWWHGSDQVARENAAAFAAMRGGR